MSELVVHVIDRLPPDGAERLLAEVVKNRSDRYEYKVLCLVEGGLLVDEIEREGVSVTVLGRRNGHDLVHARKLFRWMRINKPKIVHTHLFTADAWGRTFAYLAGVPGIFSTVHSTNAWKTGLHRFVDKLLARVSDRVIACTEEVKVRIGAEGIPESRLVCIPNGVDLNRLEQAEPVDLQANFQLPEDVLVFALIGRLHEAKGHKDLIPILAELVQEGHKFVCLFVGEGDLEKELRDEIKIRNIEDKVVFTGFRSDAIGIIKSLDFLVMPSRWEGLPITLLESMACGIPVLASRVGGIPDIVDHQKNGLLVEAGDTGSFKSSLIKLLTDDLLRRKLAVAAKRKIRQQYSAAAVAKAYESLYDKVS